QGPQGERGLPGVNAVPADEAVGTYLEAESSNARAGARVAVAADVATPGNPIHSALTEQVGAQIDEVVGTLPRPEGFAVEVLDGDIYATSDLTGIRRQLTDGLTITDGPHMRGPGVLFTTDTPETLWVPFRGGDPRPPETDTGKLAGWGSSTMAGLGPGLAGLANVYGATYYSGGFSGQTGQVILARLGSRKLRLAADVTIPAGTSQVTVTFSNLTPQQSALSFNARLGGIDGLLQKAAGVGSPITFQRHASGVSTLVEAGAELTFTGGEDQRQAVTILNPFKNDLARNVEGWVDVEDAITWTIDAYDWLGSLGRQVVVLGHFVDTDLADDDPARERILRWNREVRAAVGSGHFLDLAGYVTSARVWTDTGITPTSDDLAHQARGNKPPSLSTDSLHLNATANAAVVGWVGEFFDRVHWFPTPDPNAPVVADDFNRADSTDLGTTPVGGATWVQSSPGQFAIAGNKLTMANVSGANRVLSVETGLSSCRVRATIKALGAGPSTSGGGIIVGFNGTEYIWLSTRVNGSTAGLQFYKLVSGSASAIGTSHTGAVAPDSVLEVRRDGDDLRGYLDGVLVCAATDSLNASATRHGFLGHLQGTALEWDDFEVLPLD
ncbi:MAG TPA: hypothetical protein VKZ89_20555, partial [Thermobifida alba]|nr:hypothetical protein [Thermobifida alba]